MTMSLYFRLLPFVVGTVAAAVGALYFTPDIGIVWGLVGYFSIKILQSTVWTVTGGPGT